MKKLTLIPGIAALALLCSPAVYGQEVVRETTTTTAAPAPVVRETTTTETAPLEATGTVTEFAPDNVIIREREGVAPVRYGFTKNVVYVDAAGNAVNREVITSGVPVRVHYVREGDRMLVDRVIVTRTAAPADRVVVERPAAAATTTTETTTSTTVTGREAKEIERLRGKIAHDEKELAEHPDRAHLQDQLARDRAALEAIQGGR